MSKRINQSGQIIVADRFVSLSDPDSKNYFRVTSSISSSDKLQESIVNDFLARYDLQIDGSTNVSYGTTLTAKVYDRDNQNYVDFPSIEFSWKDVSGKILKNAHNILYIPADYRVEESTEKKVVCTWNHIVDYSIGTTLKNVEVEINTFAQLSVLDIVEYQWNNCLTEQELEEQGFKQLEWYTSIPANENNNLYLWSRRSTNNRVTWNYYRTTGQKGEDGQTAKDIKIISTRYYFDRAEKNSSGGKGDYVANQIAVLSLRYFGIGDTEQVEWYFNGDLRYTLQIDRAINLDYTSLENKNTLDISVKYNGEIYDTIQIKTNVIKSTYAGILPSSDINPIEINGREVIDGDHFIYINSNGEPIVRLFTDGKWKDITGEDSAYYSQVMSNVLYDVMKQQEVISTENGTYNFFRQLASFSAFIENLFVKNLNINNNKFNVTIGFDSNKNLTFDITWDGSSLFKISPTTGKIFFGKSSGDTIINGFMYDPLTNKISSKDEKVVIDSNGVISISDGVFSGKINSKNGYFEGVVVAKDGSFSGRLDGANGSFTGNFITPSIESRPKNNQGNITTLYLPSDAEGQFNAFSAVSVPSKHCTAKLSSDTNVKYLLKSEFNNQGATTVTYYMYNNNLKIIYSMTRYSVSGSSGASYSTDIPSGTLEFGIAMGDILIFKDIQIGSDGLESGQIYRDRNNQLFIVP